MSSRTRTATTKPAGDMPSSHVAPPTRSGRGIRLTALSLPLAALLALSVSVPAQSLVSASGAETSRVAAAKKGRSAGPPQSVEVPATFRVAAVYRDGFDATSVEELAAARAAAVAPLPPQVRWPVPLDTPLNDYFGPRSCAGCSPNHGGQDFNPGMGAPISSIADGTVVHVEDANGSLGVHLVVEHVIAGRRIASVYAHMTHGSVPVREGDIVTAGQTLGTTGNTGMSTGPHLHFEIRDGGRHGASIDPLAWLIENTGQQPAGIHGGSNREPDALH